MSTSRITVVSLGAALVLALASGIGSAAGGDSTPAPTRDHGHGKWYERACDVAQQGLANCNAQVVSSADGTPLATAAAAPSALGPSQFHAAYNLPTTAPNAQTIAIVDAYDDPTIESDLGVYSAAYGLPPCTTANGCFRKVNQTGGTLYPLANSGWALEIALDVETAHAICQNCKILLVEATTNANTNLYAAENEAVALGANAISNSWSTNEYPGETRDDTTYFNHPGVAITASSGDGGYGVQYPAASRYVTAVGGTTLAVNSDGSYSGESAWSGSGSGCSVYEPKPAWQTDAGCGTRTVADVSADADPNTGAAIYDSVSYLGQTGWFQVGGTSLSSPIIASAFALTGNAGAASAPYARTSLLHDVTTGSNGSCSPVYLCTAVGGYDGPTGLGSPNGVGAFTAGSLPSDFSLSASPPSQTVAPGGGASYTVTVNASGGFAGSVGLSASGLPAGATPVFNPTSTTTSSTLTVSTTASVASGSYPFTITGTSGALTHTTTATLVVQSSGSGGDFSLSASPPSQTVAPGGGASYTVTVNASGGFAGSVGLSASGLPAGATPVFNPTSTTTSSTLTVSTTASVAGGSYPFTITGTSGALTHTTTATLVVQATAPAGDFSLSASPASQTVSGFKSVTYTVTIQRGSGFTKLVTLSAGGLPPGFGAKFGPNPTTLTAKLTITGVGGGSTPSTITITGTSGGYSHTASVVLIH